MPNCQEHSPDKIGTHSLATRFARRWSENQNSAKMPTEQNGLVPNEEKIMKTEIITAQGCNGLNIATDGASKVGSSESDNDDATWLKSAIDTFENEGGLLPTEQET
jgi:hypothetical protein